VYVGVKKSGQASVGKAIILLDIRVQVQRRSSSPQFGGDLYRCCRRPPGGVRSGVGHFQGLLPSRFGQHESVLRNSMTSHEPCLRESCFLLVLLRLYNNRIV
jgi:hypothetical protein